MHHKIVRLFLLGTLVVQSPAMAAKHMQFIEVQNHTIDLGAKGDLPGNILTFNDVLKDKASKAPVATEPGFCVRVDPAAHVWQCEFTIVFSDGQLNLSGRWSDVGDSSFAVTGGTGTYRGARGVMLSHSAGTAGAGDLITLDLD